MLCIIVLMHMYRLQNCYCLDAMTSHPLTTYVTVPGLALVTVPLFSFNQSFEQLLQSLVLLPSCVPACMLMFVID